MDTDNNIRFFLERANAEADAPILQPMLGEFFNGQALGRHVICKRSILYFYEGENIINTYACNSGSDDDIAFTFDGEKIARVQPQYYTGSASGWSSEFEVELYSSNNNNNNNNNNNGNNNG